VGGGGEKALQDKSCVQKQHLKTEKNLQARMCFAAGCVFPTLRSTAYMLYAQCLMLVNLILANFFAFCPGSHHEVVLRRYEGSAFYHKLTGYFKHTRSLTLVETTELLDALFFIEIGLFTTIEIPARKRTAGMQFKRKQIKHMSFSYFEYMGECLGCIRI